MKIFVLGRSRTGKSPFAAHVANRINATHIMASQWVRQEFVPARADLDRAEFIAAITAFSLKRLASDPAACVDFIKAKYDLSKLCVIEGIRSLHDFVMLFDATRDRVVFLEHDGNELQPTLFERGLVHIDQHVRLQVELGLLPTDRVVRYCFPELREDLTAEQDCQPVPDEHDPQLLRISSLDRCILHYAALLQSALGPDAATTPSGGGSVNRIHASIKGMRVFVRSEFLHDMDDSFAGKLESGLAFAISSYPGHTPTFKVLLDGGSVFSYLPPHALLTKELVPELNLSLEQLVYHNCPAGSFAISTFAELTGAGTTSVFIKKLGVWLSGSYQFTLDWFEGNDLVHCICLDNGQIALLPSHKVKFKGGASEFPGYRKLHAEWRIDQPPAEKSPVTTT